MILDKLKAYGFMALAIILGVLLGLQTWRLHTSQLETASAVTTLANERAAAAAGLVLKQEQFRATEHSLAASASQTRKQINDQVTSLTVQRDALRNRLRLAEAARNSVLSGSSPVADDGQGGPTDAGAELYEETGATEVDEAFRGDVLRLHLTSCYRQYDRAEEALRPKP